jgi:hypothetical protein
MLTHAARLLTLIAGTAIGGWLSAHLQLGISGYWGIGSDEAHLVGFVVLVSVFAVVVLFLPLSAVARRSHQNLLPAAGCWRRP